MGKLINLLDMASVFSAQYGARASCDCGMAMEVAFSADGGKAFRAGVAAIKEFGWIIDETTGDCKCPECAAREPAL